MTSQCPNIRSPKRCLSNSIFFFCSRCKLGELATFLEYYLPSDTETFAAQQSRGHQVLKFLDKKIKRVIYIHERLQNIDLPVSFSLESYTMLVTRTSNSYRSYALFFLVELESKSCRPICSHYYRVQSRLLCVGIVLQKAPYSLHQATLPL